MKKPITDETMHLDSIVEATRGVMEKSVEHHDNAFYELLERNNIIKIGQRDKLNIEDIRNLLELAHLRVVEESSNNLPDVENDQMYTTRIKLQLVRVVDTEEVNLKFKFTIRDTDEADDSR